jgi:hypothetical protein
VAAFSEYDEEMQTRLDYSKAAPGSVQAMYRLQRF